MSRMTISLIAVSFFPLASAATAQPTQPISAEGALTAYERLTATRPNCRRTRSGNEITVCGKRDADRYRLPLVIKVKGDPRGETLDGERVRLQNITTPCQDNSVFLVGCGFAGVSVTTRLDGARVKTRPLAD